MTLGRAPRRRVFLKLSSDLAPHLHLAIIATPFHHGLHLSLRHRSAGPLLGLLARLHMGRRTVSGAASLPLPHPHINAQSSSPPSRLCPATSLGPSSSASCARLAIYLTIMMTGSHVAAPEPSPLPPPSLPASSHPTDDAHPRRHHDFGAAPLLHTSRFFTRILGGQKRALPAALSRRAHDAPHTARHVHRRLSARRLREGDFRARHACRRSCGARARGLDGQRGLHVCYWGVGFSCACTLQYRAHRDCLRRVGRMLTHPVSRAPA